MFKKSSTWLKTFNWLQISLYLLFIVVVFIVSFLSIRTFVDSDELISIISISIEITIVALTTLLTITLFLRNKVNQKEAALMEIKVPLYCEVISYIREIESVLFFIEVNKNKVDKMDKNSAVGFRPHHTHITSIRNINERLDKVIRTNSLVFEKNVYKKLADYSIQIGQAKTLEAFNKNDVNPIIEDLYSELKPYYPHLNYYPGEQ